MAQTASEHERWTRVKAVFLGALECSESERSEFVARACGTDTSLRREVESLLASEAAAGSFCETPAATILSGCSADDTAARLEPGTRLGAYEITGFLAAGGMGDVYRARHTVLDRDVAIKTISARSPDPLSKARLIREARHAATLAHPNVCTIYEVGEENSTPFIAMGFVEGRSLREISRSAVPPLHDALRYGVQVADAVEHAHQHGVVHGDIKSSNVVVDTSDRPIVLDFGLARSLPQVGGGAESFSALSSDGALAGTLSHMAPEVLLGNRPDARSDVWSLGVLLYELTTGNLPFTRQTSFETGAAILNEPPKSMDGSIPLAVQLIIERCLNKDPGKRYPRAAALRDALNTVTRRSSWPLIGRLLVSTRRRTLSGVAAATLLAVALVASGSALFNARGGSPGPEGLLSPIYARTAVAVLPFEILSGGDLNPYRVGAFHNEVVAQLSRVPALTVSSRSWVSAQAGTDIPLRQVANELSAGSVLRVRLQSVRGRLLVGAQLLDAVTGAQLWTQNYDNAFSDDVAQIRIMAGPIVAGVTAALAPPLPPEPRLVFISDRDGNHEIYTMNSDGTNATRLTDNPGNDLFPAWSPDGRYIAFNSVRGDTSLGRRDIYIMNADGSDRRRVTRFADTATARGGPGMPSWSPDGGALAFHVSRADGDMDIHVVNVDGTGLRRLTRAGSNLHADWSPNGRQLLFMATQKGSTGGQLHVMNTDGSGLRQLTSGTSNNGAPSWSYDGRRVAFSSSPGGDAGDLGRQIHVMNPDGSGLFNASRSSTRDDAPSWSRSGHIYFQRDSAGSRQIYVMDPDGGNQRRVTSGPGSNFWVHSK